MQVGKQLAAILAGLFLAGAMAIALPPVSDPLKVLPLGDSITQGRAGNSDKGQAPTYSWRYPLWKMLVDAGLENHVDFVGSLTSGFEGSPDWADYAGKVFDRHHEGHWGWTTQAILEQLPGWLEEYEVDVAVIFLGSNDAKRWGIEETVTHMRAIIATLRDKNAEVQILLGLPFQEWEPFPEMRLAYRAVASELDQTHSPVVIVDPSKGWVSNPEKEETDTVDWVHPNTSGDSKIAACICPVLKDLLKSSRAGD